ncbi:DUF2092 domain-containing protein [Pararobbsia alpina]|uniref:DUF2092 domain-containing protein n=1 Tax=Pararobbsia alpina TaxID=621374 RepID=A0A6S7C4J8_9BURK|nr:DUF2092 domain-containing protein [Pararobbsia alpina]CAB3801239.1 hypothetical protein LMG28138_04978 [Pararobbsia alpina]
MRLTIEAWRCAARALCVAAFVLTAAPTAHSAPPQKESAARAPAAEPETASQAQARAILMNMAEFLGGMPRFRVSLRAGYDAVQPSGQKIEFGENRTVTLSRPDRLRVEGERSDGAKTLTVFTGKEIVLVDLARKVYATAAQPGTLDDTVVYFVRDLGMRLPLAAMLLSRLPAEFQNRVRSVDYVEKTSIYGIASHHLAARTDTVDFQVWVADGDKPLPVRIVLTYKAEAGQPQFWAEFSNWNLAPEIDDVTFSAQVPDGLQKVAFAAQLPRVSPVAGKASGKKGAK